MILGFNSRRRVRSRGARHAAAWIAIAAAAVAASCAPPSLEDYAIGPRPNGGASGSDETGAGTGSGAGNTSSLAGGSGGAHASGGGAGKGNIGGGGSASTGGATSLDSAGMSGSGDSCMPEICNGLDDDCDHIVDNGCPASFERGAATPGTALGDSTGGSAYSEICGNDEVLVGMQVAFSNWLDQITFKCQAFSLGVSTKSIPYQYSVELGATHLLAAHPATTSDTLQTLNCPAGKILVGLAVGEQHTTPQFTPDYLVLTTVSGTCADLMLDLTANPPKLRWSNPTSIGPLSGSLFDSTLVTSLSTTLTNDQIAVGFQGDGGLWVDRVGPIESSVQVLLQ